MASEVFDIGNELRHGALADSVHDFKIPKVFSTKKDIVTLADVLLTLPAKSEGMDGYSAKSEHDMLHKILGTTPGTNPIRQLIRLIEEGGGTIRRTIKGLSTSEYTIKILNKGDSNNVRTIKKTLSLEDYDTFFNLGGGPLNMVIDAQSIGIKSLFSHALKVDGKSLTVNSIINREVINDPASKIYNVGNFVKINNGVSYNIIRDDSKDTIKYNSFENESDALLRNKFYSTLDLSLSPLLNTANNKLPRITLDILNKQKELIYQTGNPHIDNAISSCWSLINYWFGSKTDKHIRCSSFFQCKRSGDWLQALSCLDTGRSYVNDADDNAIVINNMKLVTLDQILLWYALFIGVDVIFTCSIPPVGVISDDIIEGSEDGNDEEDDSEDPTKPQKILLYFTLSEPETPEAKLIRLKAEANKNSEKNYKQYIAEYNSMVQSVVNDIENEIDTEYQQVIEEINKSKSLTSNIMIKTRRILELFWKLTALDYIDLKEPVSPADINSADIETLDKYISHTSSIDAVMKRITSKNDILYKPEAYEINPDYINIINPFVTIKTLRAGTDTPGIRCAKTCSYLKFRLPHEPYMTMLITYLTNIKDTVKEKWPTNFDSFAINKIIELLKVNNIDNISDIMIEYLKKKNTKAEIQSVQSQATDATANADTNDEDDVAMDASEILDINTKKGEILIEITTDAGKYSLKDTTSHLHESIENYSKKIIKIQGGLDKSRADLEKAKTPQSKRDIEERIRKMENELVRLNISKSSLEKRLEGRKAVLNEYRATRKPIIPREAIAANVIIDITSVKSPKIKRAMTSSKLLDVPEYASALMASFNKRSVSVGGGKPLSKDNYAYILFLIYLNTLIETINGYEMMNGSDYIYYEALARIVISAIKVHNGDCLELLDVIYIDLIDADISAIKNKDFKDCVQVAALNIALQSIGLRRGNIPYTGNNYRNMVKHTEHTSEFDKITSIVKGKTFQERQLYIISILQDYVQSLTVKLTAPIMVPPLYVYTRGGKINTRIVKKYKRKNGSPRRKTLRKTRRHR